MVGQLHCLRILFSVPTPPPSACLSTSSTWLHCLRILFSVPTCRRTRRPPGPACSTASASCSPFRRVSPARPWLTLPRSTASASCSPFRLRAHGRRIRRAVAPLPPHPVLRSDCSTPARRAARRGGATASASCSPFRLQHPCTTSRPTSGLHCLRILFSVPTMTRSPTRTLVGMLHCLRILFSVPTEPPPRRSTRTAPLHCLRILFSVPTRSLEPPRS